MRTALICHHDDALDRDVLPRFLASFSDLAGVVVIEESRGRLWRRIRSEWRRSRLRILDVVAFRLFYRLRLAGRDRAWLRDRRVELLHRYPVSLDGVPSHTTRDPNSEGARAFLASVHPDVVVARCKTLLRPAVSEVAPGGTVVLHPGICPEYRNAHGCFWALARRDLDHVGATLLRIDEGIDTGPAYAYYRSDIDERAESHVVIQHRVVFDNLEGVARDLQALHEGNLPRIDTTGRPSAAWGQPRLSDYRRWKRAAAAGAR